MRSDILAIRGLRLVTDGPERRVLVDGVDLSAGSGSRIGIVGDSGSGKSLTLLAAVGLLPAAIHRASGDITVDGRRSEDLGHAELARVRAHRIALLPQGAASSLSPTWTVGSQLTEAVRLHRGLHRHDARRTALELLSSVAVERPDELFRAWPHQISGGQAQRVVLALALAGRPAVLLADEPTTGLDGPTASRLLDVVERVCEDHRMGLVIVSHDLAVVARTAQHVLVMLAGRIVEDGPVTAVLSDARHPYSRRLVAAATGGDPGTLEHDPDVSESGCRWAPRCALRRAECLIAEPELAPVGRDHRARCPVTRTPETVS